MAKPPDVIERPVEAPQPAALHHDPKEVIGRRIGAALVEIGVLFVAFVLLGLLTGDSESGDGGARVTLDGAGFIVFLGLTLLYYFLQEAATGQTLGKRLLGVRVRAVDGAEPVAGRIALRTLLRLIDSLPFLYLVGFVVMIARPRRQRIGDLAARTVVARA